MKAKKEKKEKKETLSVDDLEEFEPGLDLDLEEYEGQQCEIEGYEVIEVKSDYGEDGEYAEGLGRLVKRLRVYSKPVTVVERDDGEDIEIRASSLFGLKFEDGKWGISLSDRAKINKFLAKLKLPHGKAGIQQLPGKTIKMRLSDKGNFLTFLY